MKILIFLILFSSKLFALEVGDIVTEVKAEAMLQPGEKMQTIEITNRQKPFLIVELMSTDCRTCLASMPAMLGLMQSIGDSTEVRTIAVDRELETDNYFFEEYADLILYPFVFDYTRDVAKHFGLRATPTLFLLDSQNNILFKHIGMVEEDTVQEIQNIVTEFSIEKTGN